MPDLHGRSLSRRDALAHMGQLAQAAGVRLATYGDGSERGVRALEVRTGTGLRFTVLIDRAFDLHEVEHKGRAVGWHSAVGVRHPALHDPEGEGGLSFTRSFSGFLVTCGLDHALVPEEVDASSYNYPAKRTVRQPLHGRLTATPGLLRGYGERWEGDRCTLWAEGEVRQVAIFGENLRLIRRIEADVGSDEIRVTDRVENAGFLLTPHMFFYHVNLGWPVIEEGARYVAPVRETLWAAHAARYRDQGVGVTPLPGPRAGFVEQVWEHDMAPDAGGEVPVAVVNDRLGFGVEIVTRKSELPCAYQWQYFQEGAYAMGVEPSTHHVLGDGAARERGEMIWLGPLEGRDYHLTVRVLDGADACAGAEARVRAAGPPPLDPFPTPTGRFPPLAGRGAPPSER